MIDAAVPGRRRDARPHLRALPVRRRFRRLIPPTSPDLARILADNPHRLGHALRGELAGLRSARRSTYRVLYEIRDHELVIIVAHIADRRDVYR